jgi:uncharacterized HAD superfamily protein
MLRIAIDIDGTIDASVHSIRFFELLTRALKWETEIFILTNRDPGTHSRNETIQELDRLGVRFDHLVITGEKEKFIVENDIKIFFENQDESFQGLSDKVTVFKTREAMNFDFSAGKWYYSDKTGINIDKE